MRRIPRLLFGLSTLVFHPWESWSAPRDVVINEVAWMGTTLSGDDEWIELKNATSHPLDLTGWVLHSVDGSPHIALGGTLPPFGLYLMERIDDNSVPGIPADKIYIGALSNTGEHLQLFDAQNNLVDEVQLWHAGNNAAKVAMERKDAFRDGTDPAAWAAALSAYAGGLGTPKAPNSTVEDGAGSDPGCDYPDSLEITSVNIGQGDATLIATPTRLMLADAGESYWNSHKDAEKIAAEIQGRYGSACRTLDYVVISHMHLDHIGYLAADEDAAGRLLNEAGGLHVEGENLRNPRFLAGFAYLVKQKGFRVGKTLIRDYKTHNPNPPVSQGGSKTYWNWRAYLESPQGQNDFHPETAALGEEQIDLGTVSGNPVEVDIVLVDGATPTHAASGCDPAVYFGGPQFPLRGQTWNLPHPPSENDVSVGFVLSLGAFNMFIGGDASGENYESEWGYRYHDVETCLAQDGAFLSRYGRKLDVLRANHHGSSHSTNQAFLDSLNPTLTIFSVGDHNPFEHVDPAVLDRALAKSVGENHGRVFMTEAGARVGQAADACSSLQPALCAEVADQEFPAATESDEAGDDGVSLAVRRDGSGYSARGFAGYPASDYSSR